MTAPLAARGLVRSFGDDVAVSGIDLRVEAGEIHAIVGLNGAGKTTLMRLLLGMLKPDSGRATILGYEARKVPSKVWQRVGHLIEFPFAYPELTVRENIAASGLLSGLDHRTALCEAQRAIDDFELGPWADRRVIGLSQGNRQRLGLASALIHRPSVVVLDEPTSSLDPAGVVFTRGLLWRLARSGAAILVSSHHFDQVARMANTVSVIHRGAVVGTLQPHTPDLEQRFFDLVHEADLTMRGS